MLTEVKIEELTEELLTQLRGKSGVRDVPPCFTRFRFGDQSVPIDDIGWDTLQELFHELNRTITSRRVGELERLGRIVFEGGELGEARGGEGTIAHHRDDIAPRTSGTWGEAPVSVSTIEFKPIEMPLRAEEECGPDTPSNDLLEVLRGHPGRWSEGHRERLVTVGWLGGGVREKS